MIRDCKKNKLNISKFLDLKTAINICFTFLYTLISLSFKFSKQQFDASCLGTIFDSQNHIPTRYKEICKEVEQNISLNNLTKHLLFFERRKINFVP